MKLYTCLFLLISLLLTQFYIATAFPIKESITLEKRKIRPFPYLNSFIYFKKPTNWGKNVNAYLYDDEQIYGEWPGIQMNYKEKEGYYMLVVENRFFIRDKNLRVIFNDGRNQAPNVSQEGFFLTMDGVYDQNGAIGITNEKANQIYFTGVEHLEYSSLIRILYRPKENYFNLCNDIYAHYKIGNEDWNTEKMTNYWSGFTYINIDVHDAEEITVAFTDGNKWDNNNNNNYILKRYTNTLIDRNDDQNYFSECE